MRQVIERLFERIQSSTIVDLGKMKDEIMAAAEEGPEGLRHYFEATGQALIQEAEGFARELKSKLGAS